ncbi:MAG: alanine/ornithine racemase family PLP-dependent enzyme [Promethearchaeota archaeon]
MPTLEINLAKIEHNARILKNLLGKRNVSIIGINKVTQGNPLIAKSLIQGGIEYIGDSRITNIIKMKENGVNAQFVLIRVPSRDEISSIVEYSDYSVNSELKIIKLLSKEAIKQKKTHHIILMIDMGDLREGIDPSNLEYYVKEILSLKNIRLSGIGTNMKCFRGIIPTVKNMEKLSCYAENIEKKFCLKLKFVSGGNSANFKWFLSSKNLGAINNLRIGEAIFLGRETINFDPIPNLYRDAFILTAEIVELKKRKITNEGEYVSNAFGEPVQKFQKIDTTSEGKVKKKVRVQALLNLGRQDTAIDGLTPIENIKILGGSSDYLIIDPNNNDYRVGQKLKFFLNYEALLRAMGSPYITKKYIYLNNL